MKGLDIVNRELKGFIDGYGFNSKYQKHVYGDLIMGFGLIGAEKVEKEFDLDEYVHELVETEIYNNTDEAKNELMVKLSDKLPKKGSILFWRRLPEIQNYKDFLSNNVEYKGFARFSYKKDS